MAAITFWETRSLCPVCLRPVSAVRFGRGHDLYMRKSCPDHGSFLVILWRGEPSHTDWVRPKVPLHPPAPATAVEKGCPFDCGLCPDHRQQTCTALIEVTQRCNLACSFCFARSGENPAPDPEIEEIRQRLQPLAASGTQYNIQLSGGEPTLRNDLPEIVAMVRSLGFEFVQVNTNGVRLGTDPGYAQKLAEAGLSSIFLQFDGLDDNVYGKLRGGPLLAKKIAAIENCGEQEIGVVLVPTLVPGINDEQIGEIVQFGMSHLPIVRGVHFQPVSYFGRYPQPPADAHRITIPEVIRYLEAQTGGLVNTSDFSPPSCEHARCSFHGTFIVMPDGELKSIARSESSCCSCAEPKAEDGAAQARRFVARQWAKPDESSCCGQEDSHPFGQWDILLDRARTHTFSISGMAFQDAWNIDLERLKECCIHVVERDGRLVPFCAYNLTGSSGLSLYPRGGDR